MNPCWYNCARATQLVVTAASALLSNAIRQEHSHSMGSEGVPKHPPWSKSADGDVSELPLAIGFLFGAALGREWRRANCGGAVRRTAQFEVGATHKTPIKRARIAQRQSVARLGGARTGRQGGQLVCKRTA
jgi:hypothetical protein